MCKQIYLRKFQVHFSDEFAEPVAAARAPSFVSGTISAINTLSAWAKNSSPNIAVAFLAHFRRPDGVLIFLLQLQGLTVVH